MAVSQERISVYSLADLKNTSDDAIPAYLNSLSFKQSHKLLDVRLALGYTAFTICAVTFLWDYKLGFDATKYYTAVAVAIYTLINGILSFWIWGVEKGVVYVGTNKNGARIEITTSTKKHVPLYNVSVATYSKASPSSPSTTVISKPFSEWFDVAGRFVALPFQEMFASNVPLIGKADPKRVNMEMSQKVRTVEPLNVESSINHKLASLLAESSGMQALDAAASSTAMSEKGGKKRSKKG